MPAGCINDNEPNPKSHEDDLVMWRTYGKDEFGNEAKGCSIVIDKNFFDEHKGFRFPIKNIAIDKEDKNQYPVKRCDSLFSVLYYDKRNKDFILNQKINNEIGDIIMEFKNNIIVSSDYIQNTSTTNKIILINLIHTLISNTRYFIKSADYAYENEIRIIHFEEPNSERIVIKNNRMYVESDKIVREHILRMNLGPKTENINKWKYLELLVNKSGKNEFKILASKCRFR